MENELAQIFTCPRCHAETAHFVLIRRGERFGLECSQCHTTSLANHDALIASQSLWEEELCQILNSLEPPEPED